MQTNKSLNLMRVIFAVMIVAVMAFTATACSKDKGGDSSSVAGVYYYDGEGSEFTVSLDDEFGFVLNVRGETKDGKFEMEGSSITFTVSRKETYQASFENGTLKLTYDGAQMVFLKKVNFTVSFETYGGTKVPDQTVLNGKTATKPADPTRNDGKDMFLGWYADANYTSAYNFSSVITADTTVYANWAEAEAGRQEVNVNFNLNYEGAAEMDSMTTTGGKLYGVTDATRGGYTFGGWWVSMYTDGTMLSYKYENDMVFNEDTTLYALWIGASEVGKLDTPIVNVTNSEISWNSVSGATTYRLEIQGPMGFINVARDVTTTSFAVDFANSPAGDYSIRVTAITNADTTANSDITTRYYKNKALAKVSGFFVAEPNSLVFSAVDNAQKYYVTVDCGNDEHTHVNLDNGNSTTFNFANCAMQEGGIVFTVTAAANGYASSVSEKFVYNRVVESVTGVSYDAETETLTWDVVKGASGYVITVANENNTYTYYNNTKNSVCIKEVNKGDYTVSVVATAKGYNPSPATEFAVSKSSVATPTNVTISGSVVTWNEVEGASGYEVKIGTKAFACDGTSFDLDTADGIIWINEDLYPVSIRAKGSANSMWTDVVDTYYYAMGKTLSYANSTLSWAYAVPADHYEVKVNDGTPVKVTGKNTYNVTLTKAGTNVLGVRFFDGVEYSEWATVEVFAHTVSFDVRSGKPMNNVYLAAGDVVSLQDATRDGYEFAGWYNAPGGATSNAMLYTDSVYAQGGDMMLFAYWKPISYVVTFDYKDGIAEGLPTDTKVNVGTSFAFPVPAPNDAAYAFIGWEVNGTLITNEFGESIMDWVWAENKEVVARFRDVFVFEDLEDGTLSVKKGEGAASLSTIVIPETYNGKRVSTIGGYAFQGLPNLIKVVIPNTVTYIDIAGTAFYTCRNLKTIEVYEVEGWNDYRYRSHDGALINYNEVEGSIDLLFFPQGNSSSFRIPDDVTSIKENVFKDSNVSEVIIPTSVRKLETDAFLNCKYLTKVTFEEEPREDAEEVGFNTMFNYIPDSNLVIEENAFSNCTALGVINIPARADAISLDETTKLPNIFTGCTNLGYINVSEDHETYSSVNGFVVNKDKNTILYVPQGRTTLEVPMGITAIGDYAFAGSLITDLVFPATLSDIETEDGTQPAIGNNAFMECRNLKTVVFEGSKLEKNDITIGKGAFQGCSRLVSVTYEENHNVKKIGEQAFEYCVKLNSVVIPAEITEVGNKAFNGCSSVSSITVEEGSTEIAFGTEVFANCKRLTEVNFPARVKALPEKVFEGCDRLLNVFVDENNAYLCDIDGVLYNKDVTEILFYSKLKTGAYDLPATVTTVAAGVFEGNKSISAITFSKELVSIGAEAFKGCINLRSVTFTAGGQGDLEIGEYAFSGCSSLESFAFPANATSVPAGILEDCALITSVTLPATATEISENAFKNTQLTAIELPAGVTKIGNYAFANTLISTVVLPDATTEIGEYAFYNCFELTSVTFNDVLTTVGKYSFTYAPITKLEFPATLATLGEYAFAYNTALTEVVFENGSAPLKLGSEGFETRIERVEVGKNKWEERVIVESTGEFSGYVFYNNTSLKKVVFADNISVIGTYVFANCTSLSEFVMSKNSQLMAIGTSAFEETAITSFYFPKTLTNIAYVKGEQTIGVGKNAFKNVTELASVEFDLSASTGTFTIGEGAFMNTSLTSVTIPSRLTSAQGYSPANTGLGLNAFAGSKLSEITIDDTNNSGAFYSENNMVFTTLYDSSKNVIGESLEFAAPTIENVVVPAFVTAVGPYAFMYSQATSITFAPAATGESEKDLTFPAGGTYYDADNVQCKYGAFVGVTMEEFIIPDRCVSAGQYAFIGANIDSIVVGAGMTTIPGYFVSQSNVKHVSFVENSTTTTLLSRAFSNTNLETISLPASLTTVGTVASNGRMTGYVFNDQPNLKSLTFHEDSRISKFATWSFGNVYLETFVFPRGTYKMNDSYASTFFKEFTFGTIYIPDDHGYHSNMFFDTNNGSLFGTGTIVLYDADAEKDPVYVQEEAGGVIYNKSKTQIVRVPSAYKAETLIIPEGVTSIAGGAFAGTTDIKKIVLPSSLTSIGSNAFLKSHIEEIEFLASDKNLTISDKAFRATYNLKSITIPGRITSIGSSVFNESNVEYVQFGTIDQPYKLTSLGSNVFYHAPMLKEITIPKTVTTLALSSFYGAHSLEKVTFESDNTLTTMANGVFRECYALEELDLPKSLKSVGQYCFADCTSLEEIVLPAGVSALQTQLFDGCTNLEVIEILGNITSIPNGTFQDCASLESMTIPDEVTNIASTAFKGCTNLETVNISGTSSLTTIGASAFEGCSSLKSIYIPTGVVNNRTTAAIQLKTFKDCKSLSSVVFAGSIVGDITIGANAFENCTSLKQITFPSNFADISTTDKQGNVTTVAAIGTYAFANSGLVEVNIPASAQTIGEYAFSGCRDLEIVNMEMGVEVLDDGAFVDCSSLVQVNIPTTLYQLGSNVFMGCTELGAAGFIFDGENDYYTIENGMLYTGDLTTIVWAFDARGDFVVDNSVIAVQAGAFANTAALTSITLHDGITEIADYTFANTGIKSITIGKNVTYIGAHAFEGCSGLTEIIFEEGGTEPLRIGEYAFAGTGVTEIVFPHRLKNGEVINERDVTPYAVGNYAFYGASKLKKVSFSTEGIYTSQLRSASVGIGRFAFANSALEEITFNEYFGNIVFVDRGGHEMQFAAIAEGAFANTRLTKLVFAEEIKFENLSLSNKVFEGVTTMTEITLPDYVSYLAAAFDDSSITTVNGGKETTNIQW